RCADSLCRFRLGQLHYRRNHQCKRRFGLVRMKFALIVGIVLLAAACLVPRAGAQNPDTMMPEQSEAKGKQILQDLMNGLGGPGDSEVRESECSGRRALLGDRGDLSGYMQFTDLRR